jgi:hypothetical protein
MSEPSACVGGGAAVGHYPVTSTTKVGKGEHKLGMAFEYDGGGAGKGGTARLFVDGAPAGQGKIDNTLGYRVSLDETFDVGAVRLAPRITACHSVHLGCCWRIHITASRSMRPSMSERYGWLLVPPQLAALWFSTVCPGSPHRDPMSSY